LAMSPSTWNFSLLHELIFIINAAAAMPQQHLEITFVILFFLNLVAKVIEIG